MGEKTISVEELKKELGIGTSLAYKLIRTPGFPAVRVGRRILVSRAGLDRWLEDNEKKG